MIIKKCFIWTIIWYVVATYAIYFHDRCFYGLLVGMKPITIWYYHLLLYAHSFHKKSATLLICLVQIHVSALKWVFIVKNGLFKNVNVCFTRDRRRLEELLNFCNRLAVRNVEFLLKPEDKKLPIQQYNKEYIYEVIPRRLCKNQILSCIYRKL